MSALPPEDGSLPVSEPVVPRRGHPIVAWTVILLLAVATIVLQRGRKAEASEAPSTSLTLMQLQARYLVGWHELIPLFAGAQNAAKAPDDLAKQADLMNTGSPEQRLAAIILGAEMRGIDTARERLQDFDEQCKIANVQLTPEQAHLRGAVTSIYTDPERLTDDDRAFLEERLGWFGRLAVTQVPGTDKEDRAAVRRPAMRTALVIVLVFAVGFLAGGLGLLGLLILFVQLAARRLAPGLLVPSGRGGIYAETFAVWMVLYLTLGIGAAFLPIPDARLLLAGMAMILSLPLALTWPVLRGIPWRTVRQDLGLTAGRVPWLEPPLGVATYLMALPLMMVGLLLTLMLLRLQGGSSDGFRPTSMPSHPVVEFLARPSWALRLQVIFLASIVAPVVEETMFRGVLYYHLRDLGWRLPRLVGFLLAGGAVSLLFAAIHPQGLATIPPLMALAFAFTLIREWRGTLVPAMIAHAVNNGVVTMLLMVALAD